MVIFTSDNGPDSSGFELYNKLGHLRMSTMRGKKAAGKTILLIFIFFY